MEGFHKNSRTCIVAKLVLGVILSLILSFTVLVQNSLADRGFCWPQPEGEGHLIGCCSEDVECSDGQVCLFNKMGVCFYSDDPCNRDADCANREDFCVDIGECPNGSPCLGLTTVGICVSHSVSGQPCLATKDCDKGICIPICLLFPPICPWMDFCEGPCFPCAIGCYIATAAFGTELEEKTDVLRSFRDKYLMNNALGKEFVTAYYTYSPAIADYIARHAWLRTTVRILLFPLIGLVWLFV